MDTQRKSRRPSQGLVAGTPAAWRGTLSQWHLKLAGQLLASGADDGQTGTSDLPSFLSARGWGQGLLQSLGSSFPQLLVRKKKSEKWVVEAGETWANLALGWTENSKLEGRVLTVSLPIFS